MDWQKDSTGAWGRVLADGTVGTAGQIEVSRQWITTTDRDGRRVYVRSTPAGVQEIDGHGAGRMRWTVTYVAGRYGEVSYGMTTTLAEARSWADMDAGV